MHSERPRARTDAFPKGVGAQAHLDGLAAPGERASVLDPQAIVRLRELDPTGAAALIKRVLQAFETSAERLRLQLAAARGANDRASMRLVAHTLKSSSASLGAMRLSQLSAQAEAAIRLESAELDPHLDAMLAALDEALSAMARLPRDRQ